MEEEHQHLDEPNYGGAVRNLKNTQSREEEEEEPMHHQRDLSCYYGLRENPKKKTQKYFGLESAEPMKKILFRCGECGKGFRYEKCLSNHQAGMHALTNQRVCEESIRSLCSSFSLVRKKKRSRVIRYKKTPLSCSFTTFFESPSVCAENDEELEVAECLILLSKSSPKFVVDGVKLVSEAMDANGFLSYKRLRKAAEFAYGVSSDEQKLMDERVSRYDASKDETWRVPASFLGHKGELDQWKLLKYCEFESGFYGNVLGAGAIACSDADTEIVSEPGKRNVEHQCRLCKKIFSSYQALGGHQTFHRMSKNKNKKNCREESVEPEDESVAVKNCREESVEPEDLGLLSGVPHTFGIEFY